RLGLGLLRARLPASAAVQLGEHLEGIGSRVERALALGAGIGAHLPGRAMAGQRVLLVARDVFRIHALEEIIGLVVLADVIEAEVPVFARVRAALRRAVRALVLAARPLAHYRFFLRTRLRLRAQLVRLDANGVEELG